MTLKFALAAAAVALSAGLAHAATLATQTMQVQATVSPACAFGTVGTFDFTNIGGTVTAITPAATSFNVTCSAGLAYSVKISSAVGNTTGTRRMVEPGIGQTMDYVLQWADATFIYSNWTDTSFPSGTGSSNPQQIFFKGIIPIQAPSGGAWQLNSQFVDTVTITIEG